MCTKRKKYTLSEVVAALDCDFEGYDEMLFDFKSFPKFGNDVPEVDELCAMVVGHFYSYLGTKRTFRGGIYGGGCSTFNRAAIYGGQCWGASERQEKKFGFGLRTVWVLCRVTIKKVLRRFSTRLCVSRKDLPKAVMC